MKLTWKQVECAECKSCLITRHGKPTTKRQTQLDLIERKLDELLSRPPVQILPPSPGTWKVPEPQNPVYEKAPWWMNPNVPPPTITCNEGEGTK